MELENKLLSIEGPPLTSSVDVTIHFTTDIEFPNKDELVEWARKVGIGLGFVVIIQRQDKLTARARPRILLTCDRSGFPRLSQYNKSFVKKNVRKSSSKRCGCPFAIQGRKDASVNVWRVEVVCGTHNHNFVHLEAHSYAGRLDEGEEKIVEDMYASGVKPRKILSTLKKRNPDNKTAMRTIYNHKFKLYKKELDGRTPIQFLYKCLCDAGYVSYSHANDNTDTLERLYFAHPTSIQLSNLFSDVFIMDCTYKTNRYRMPLLSIVGLTSTYQSYFSGFCFMSNETEESYKWALECFRGTLYPSSLPIVFVIDRELALINAIKHVFPQSKTLLCQLHISRNILAHCKKHFKEGKDCETFLGVWQNLVNSPTMHEFNLRYNSMLTSYADTYPEVTRYVVTTWIDPYKECFVSSWTDSIFHLGNCTTNRVESGHSQLKRFLAVSIGNLTTVWKSFHQMITLQHTEIKKSFGQSIIQINTMFSGALYSNLVGFVSIAALDIMKKEEDRVRSGYPEASDCTHRVRNTLGLPCAHELVIYINQSNAFPLWMIHKHWKKLTLDATPTEASTPIKEEYMPPCGIQTELDCLLKKYNSYDDIHKQELKRKLRELLEPSTSKTIEPYMPLRLKGRPKGSNNKLKGDFKSTKRDPSHFEHVIAQDEVQSKRTLARKMGHDNKRFLNSIRKEMPSYISKYIVDAINVTGDGHCGYRVISQALDMKENWKQVRIDLSKELHERSILYSDIYGSVRLHDLLQSLDCNSVPAPLDKWMSMPDMGLVIASCYNVAVVHFSRFQSFTFLPLHSTPLESRKTIFIGFVNDNHFIQLQMMEDCPMPPIFSVWMRYHEAIADEWAVKYGSNIVSLADP